MIVCEGVWTANGVDRGAELLAEAGGSNDP